MSSLKDICNLNGKRCLDDDEDDVDDDDGMVEDIGGANMVETKMDFEMDTTKPALKLGPKSRTGKSRVIRAKKKIKMGQEELIGFGFKKITSYFHLVGTTPRGDDMDTRITINTQV